MSLVSVYVHSKLCGFRRPFEDDDVPLTQREIECLSWAAEGKTDAEIGVILDISSKTVNYHVENTKKKFGVGTRIQAVVGAMRRRRIW
jgi:DNA-binding CsgD family transcriptional regulator